MTIPAFVLGLALATSAPLALADKLGPAPDAPESYQGECGACHTAFPPQLLPAKDWQRIMSSLEKHYGDNASIDDKARREILGYLTRYSDNGKVGAGGTASASELPRLTRTDWFIRKHREVPVADWKHDKVKSAANCNACHTRAAAGSFREREIVMPNGRRWED
jgi:mono/diheme cytochrome c family protein